MAVLDFIEAFEIVLASWPDGEKRTFHQLAEQTKTSTPHVLDHVSLGMGRSVDVHDPIARKEGEQALFGLKDKLRNQLDARERRRQAQRERSVLLYDKTQAKVRQRILEKNLYGAYRTLSYFAGVHREFLPKPLLIEIANDCLRLGFKADVNHQELGIWLQLGVRNCLAVGGEDALEDAQDFLETYREHFCAGGSSQGERLVERIAREVKARAEVCMPEFSQFNFTQNEDSFAADLDQLNATLSRSAELRPKY